MLRVLQVTMRPSTSESDPPQLLLTSLGYDIKMRAELANQCLMRIREGHIPLRAMSLRHCHIKSGREVLLCGACLVLDHAEPKVYALKTKAALRRDGRRYHSETNGCDDFIHDPAQNELISAPHPPSDQIKEPRFYKKYNLHNCLTGKVVKED